MARYPGTERPANKAGWQPAAPVRARRSRANGALGIADRRGFVSEVRAGHIRVRFGRRSGSIWLPSEAVVAEPDLQDPELERLREAHAALAGLRLEEEEGGILIVFSEGFEADALDRVRASLGDALVALRVEAFGVHEVAVRMRLAPSDG